MKNKLLQSALTAFLILTAGPNANATEEKSQEKCYGLAKAGMNDCATATSSCAGSATKDSQPDAFVFLPSGLCERLVEGSLKPKLKGKQ